MYTRPSESILKSAKTLPPWRHKQKLHGLVPVVLTYFEISTGIHLYWQTSRQTDETRSPPTVQPREATLGRRLEPLVRRH